GACASGLALTVLGFLAVPFKVSLALVLVAGAALALFVWRRTDRVPAARGDLAWAGWIAVLLACLALVPMFSLGYLTVTGTGSDAHMAAGTADFLQHAYPTSVDAARPVDQMPLLWRSKYPIYYALGGVSTLAGLQSFQTLVVVAAILLALAGMGWFLVARELLGIGTLGAVAAAGLAGLDRGVLHTGLNPYFNQTWGYFALPFALVLAWPAAGGALAAGALGAPARRRAAGLLVVFLATIAFAYPLALPIPLVPLVVAWALQRRARRRRGEPVWSPRDLYRGRRSLLWLVPLGLALAVPVYGVAEKAVGAARVVVDPNASLAGWAGDLPGFVPTWQFFSLGSGSLAALALVAVGVLAVVGLARLPRALALSLGAVAVLGVALAIYFHERAYGWYFHFKLLAFVGPLIVVCAAAGAMRLRAFGAALLGAWLAFALVGARDEILGTGKQLNESTIAVQSWSRSLPAGASVRLDMWAPDELWAAYMLSRQRVCSQAPLFGTDYPRVPISRKADYVLVDRRLLKPVDAVGTPVRENVGWALYRLSPSVPGRDRCSQRMVQQVTSAY
ncbi:MAG TPA: hypothetical protein VGN78_07555, partial [Solirubrobacteraceae bacterium]|nr:hypothetical protein [Solirubrobacteraceae bacterium]